MTDTWAALRGSRVLILSLQYFFWSAGLYGFVLWLPSIVDAGAKQGIGITGLLSAVPYLAAVGCMLAVSKLSDRAGKREQFVWPFLLISGVAFFLSYWTAGLSFWLAYLFLIVAGAGMYAPYGPFYAAIPEMLPKNVSGQAMAFVNACGSLGGFAGTWLVGILAARPLGSESSFLLMATALTVSGLIMLFLPKRSVINVPLQTSRNH